MGIILRVGAETYANIVFDTYDVVEIPRHRSMVVWGDWGRAMSHVGVEEVATLITKEAVKNGIL